MANDDGYVVLGGLVIAVIYIVAVPVLIWFAYQYHKRVQVRSDEDSVLFFNRRNPTSIYCMILFAILTLAIERPFNLAQTLLGVFKLHVAYQLAIYTAFYFGFIYIFILRTFILLWNFKYSQAKSRLIWKKVLNPEYDDWDNVYIKWNHVLGDFTNTGPCSALTWILAVILLPIFVVATGWGFELGSIVVLLFPFTFGIWLVFKISKVTDQYGIRNELTNGFKIIACTMVCYLIIFLFVGVIADEHELEIVFFTFVQIGSTVMLCYFSTIWVIKQLDKKNSESRTKQAMDLNGNNKDDNGKREHKMTADDIENYEKNKKTLRDLLRDKEGYNIFMEHLVKEMSIENLLFVTEYIQFKQNLKNEKWIPKIIGWFEKIPSSLPVCETLQMYPTSDQTNDPNDDTGNNGSSTSNRKNTEDQIPSDDEQEEQEDKNGNNNNNNNKDDRLENGDNNEDSNESGNDNEMKEEIYVTPQGPEDEKEKSSNEVQKLKPKPKRKLSKKEMKEKEERAKERELQLNVSYQLKFLYSKYIFDNSELCLNISSSLRKKYNKRFDKSKHGDDIEYKIFKLGSKRWCVFYDEAAIAIWKLMNDSFQRFQSNVIYEKWLEGGELREKKEQKEVNNTLTIEEQEKKKQEKLDREWAD